MMLLLQSRLKQHQLLKLRQRINILKRGVFILPFFLFLFYTTAFGQQQTKLLHDTITLFPFEYIQLVTNNGSSCVYYVGNTSNAEIATIVNVGAPDSLKFNDNSLFNGIHHLVPGQQLIAVGDFMGRQLSTINLSSKVIPVTLMLYCPN
jgi:hypothetical protein